MELEHDLINNCPIKSHQLTHAHILSVYRTGRGISGYQLVSGAGDTTGQSPLRLVEPHSRRLPAGLGAAGHLGHLRQGLRPPQGSPRQPARLLPLVRRPALQSSWSLTFDSWKFPQAVCYLRTPWGTPCSPCSQIVLHILKWPCVICIKAKWEET